MTELRATPAFGRPILDSNWSATSATPHGTVRTLESVPARVAQPPGFAGVRIFRDGASGANPSRREPRERVSKRRRMRSCTPTIPRTRKAPVNPGAFLFESAFVLDLGEARKRRDRKAVPRRSSRKLLELLDRAEAWHRELTRGSVNQSGLAHRHGITRARVTQVLGLLRLHPEIVAPGACRSRRRGSCSGA